jgi:hypothetical protein
MSVQEPESMGVEYADHEVQGVAVKGTLGGDSSSAEFDEFIELDPVEPSYLDADEVAELVGYRVQISVDPADASGQEAGFVGAEFDMGINMDANAETLTQLGGNAQVLNRSGSDLRDGTNVSSDDNVVAGVNSIRGQLWGSRLTLSQSFSSSSNSYGGAAPNPNQHFDEDLRDKFGSGPYVDASDDLVFHIELNKFSYQPAVSSSIHAILYWNVETVEGGRPAFSRPTM